MYIVQHVVDVFFRVNNLRKICFKQKTAVKTTGFFLFAIGRWKMCNMKKNNNKLQFNASCTVWMIAFFGS